MSTSKSRKPQVNPFQSLMKVERLWEKKLPAKRIQRLHSKIHCSFQFNLLWRRCYLKWQKRYSWFFFRLDFCLSPCLQAASQSCLCGGRCICDPYISPVTLSRCLWSRKQTQLKCFKILSRWYDSSFMWFSLELKLEAYLLIGSGSFVDRPRFFTARKHGFIVPGINLSSVGQVIIL